MTTQMFMPALAAHTENRHRRAPTSWPSGSQVGRTCPTHAEEQRIDVMRDGIAQVWAAIQSGNFYPSPSPQNCATCPFRSRCPIFARR